MMMTGVIHGKTIELKIDPHLPDGVEVALTIVAKQSATKLPPSEGFRRSAGALANDPKADAILAQIATSRKEYNKNREIAD